MHKHSKRLAPIRSYSSKEHTRPSENVPRIRMFLNVTKTTTWDCENAYNTPHDLEVIDLLAFTGNGASHLVVFKYNNWDDNCILSIRKAT